MGRIALLVFLAAFAAACSPLAGEESLELIGFRQNAFQHVALNEELVFSFSEDLERSSITLDSLRVLDERNQVAAGERAVRGSVLSFLPELPRAGELSDGGFRPGTTYRVVLGGFPRPDGIRSRSGALLSATLVLTFRTAERGGEHPLFLETFAGVNPLLPTATVLGPLDRIELACGEALDPATVSADDFALTRFADLQRVSLDATLAENTRRGALLRLVPRRELLGGSVLAPGEYYLEMVARGLRTLGGRSVEPSWGKSPLNLTVRGPTVRTLVEDFTRSANRERTSREPPGCDGTAAWAERISPERTQPGVRVRLPAAVGSGADGVVELRSERELTHLPARVEATQLSVPQDALVDLSGHAGAVVLGAQAALDVRGRIVRRLSPGQTGLARETLARELEQLTSRVPGTPLPTLSAWLERALQREEPWTILIAGADLRVPKGGAIDVDGPLLLVAGGWIRVEGFVEAREVWKSPGGGGSIRGDPPRRLGGESAPGLRELPLEIDPPLGNILKRPLRLGVLSRPIRRGSGSWRPALVEASSGIGNVRVSFLGVRPDGAGDEVGPVDDLLLLEGFPEIRFLVELEVPAGTGEAWDPPRLERLTLAWDESLLSSDRGEAGSQ